MTLKNKKLFWIASGLLAVLFWIPAYAQAEAAPAAAEEPVSIGEGLNKRIALDLRDMDIVDALKFLSMKGSVNILAGKDVAGRVSLFVKNVTIKESLDLILLANNLAYEQRGDILYVMTGAEYKTIHGQNFQDNRKAKIFKIQYSKPEAVAKSLDLLKSELGKLIVDEDSGTVIVMDTPEKVAEMEKAVAVLDQPLETKRFPFQYARAKDIQALFFARLDAKKTGTVALDEKNNQLIVNALPDRMKEIEKMAEALDQKTKQVLLEAKILKVILSDNFDMGVDWQRVWVGAEKKGVNLAGDFAFPTGTGAPTNFFQMGLNNIDPDHSYALVLQLLQEFGETRNLSSPSITVVSGEEAKIHVGRTEAYVTTTIATGSTTSSTAAQVTFIDVGVQLTVTPTINDKGFIYLKIKPEVSNVDDSLTYQIAADVNNTVPLVARTTAETTVLIKDGTTLVIGGLRKDEKVKTVDKLPFLGDMPLVGGAFRKNHDALDKTEVIVFITPHIVNPEIDVVDSRKKPKGVRAYKTV